MWLYNNKKIKSIDDFPSEAIGFIYKITNEDNGKVYYRRKTCRGFTKKKLTKKEKLIKLFLKHTKDG